MSRILVIGVGGAGRETVKHMKDNGIPEADYLHSVDLKIVMEEEIFRITIY